VGASALSAPRNAIGPNYLADMDRVELLHYIGDLRSELRTVRATLHAAVGMLAKLTAQLHRSQQTVIRLHDMLREERRAAA
jgi:hypothetical protein